MSDGDSSPGDRAEAQTGGGGGGGTEGLHLMLTLGGLFCAVTFTSVLHLNSSRLPFLRAMSVELSQR